MKMERDVLEGPASADEVTASSVEVAVFGTGRGRV